MEFELRKTSPDPSGKLGEVRSPAFNELRTFFWNGYIDLLSSSTKLYWADRMPEAPQCDGIQHRNQGKLSVAQNEQQHLFGYRPRERMRGGCSVGEGEGFSWVYS